VKTPKAQIFLASGGGTSKQLFPGVLFLNNTAPCKKFMADCSDMGSSKQIHSFSAKKSFHETLCQSITVSQISPCVFYSKTTTEKSINRQTNKILTSRLTHKASTTKFSTDWCLWRDLGSARILAPVASGMAPNS